MQRHLEELLISVRLGLAGHVGQGDLQCVLDSTQIHLAPTPYLVAVACGEVLVIQRLDGSEVGTGTEVPCGLDVVPVPGSDGCQFASGRDLQCHAGHRLAAGDHLAVDLGEPLVAVVVEVRDLDDVRFWDESAVVAQLLAAQVDGVLDVYDVAVFAHWCIPFCERDKEI